MKILAQLLHFLCVDRYFVCIPHVCLREEDVKAPDPELWVVVSRHVSVSHPVGALN